MKAALDETGLAITGILTEPMSQITDPVSPSAHQLSKDGRIGFYDVQFDQTGVDKKASAVISQVQGGIAVPVYPSEIATAPIRYPRKPFE